MAEIAAELVRLRVDVIIATGTAPALAAKQATSAIPIVFPFAGDPIGSGLVTSLARPGGNITGMSNQATDLAAKRIELLREIVPHLHRLAVLANAGYPAAALEKSEVETAARTLGLEVVPFEVRESNNIAPAFEAVKGKAEALFLVGDPLMTANRTRVTSLALAARLPTIYVHSEYVDAGGLMSYGANFPDLFRRSAEVMDKILRGTKPGDIPVEQPTKFELVINLKTAKALGLEIPADPARPRRRGDRMRPPRVHHAARRRGGVWPLAARAQQRGRVRRVGVFMSTAEDDTEFKARVAAFLQGLQELGWTDGRNMRIDVRWPAGDAERIRRYATEFVALAPDVILATGATVGPLLQATRDVPIVFTIISDPVGAGFVDSLARPGGNATGFITFEYSLSGKWLELLKQIAPHVTRAAVLRDSSGPSGIGQFGAIQTVAPSLGMEVSPISMRDPGEIERAVAAFARSSNGGLVVTGSALAVVHRDLIITLAGRHKLPAVYFQRLFAAGGGLISYGTDFVDQYRRAAGYVDRILKGEKPADLPVQAPTRLELAINLKTAKALGLDVPPSLLARADEVIE